MDKREFLVRAVSLAAVELRMKSALAKSAQTDGPGPQPMPGLRPQQALADGPTGLTQWLGRLGQSFVMSTPGGEPMRARLVAIDRQPQLDARLEQFSLRWELATRQAPRHTELVTLSHAQGWSQLLHVSWAQPSRQSVQARSVFNLLREPA